MLAVVTSGLIKGMVPLPGGGTAIYNSSGLDYIHHKDWLGSSRLTTTWAHAVYSKESYAPFGETYNEQGTADRSFTGQDQNVVTGSGGTGVYDYLFRKYDPSAGRWLSPDPDGWGAVSQADPQSLNRYAYVENQPMNADDPDGLSCVYDNSTGVSAVVGDDEDGLGCAAAGVAPGSTSGNVISTADAVSTIVFGSGDSPYAVSLSYNALYAFLTGATPFQVSQLPGVASPQELNNNAISQARSKVEACQASATQDAINNGITPSDLGNAAIGNNDLYKQGAHIGDTIADKSVECATENPLAYLAPGPSLPFDAGGFQFFVWKLIP